MSLTAYLVVAFGFAALAWLVRSRTPWSSVIGVAGLGAAGIVAIALDPGAAVPMGEGTLAMTAYLRVFLILGSVVGLGLAIGGLAGETRRDLPAITLATLGIGALTLSVTDPRVAVIAGTAGGLGGALLSIRPNGDRAGGTVGIRHVRSVVTAGVMAIAATAWLGRDLSQLDAQPVVFGLAYLALALAVAIRFGAIPFHLWAARLTDVVPDTALPIVTILAAAPFAVVGLSWVDTSIATLLIDLGTERGILLAVAVGSIVLAALAALVQDEVEHLVGYSIVGDAGVALLGLVALDGDAWGPARTWILAMVVARSAFAAWAGGIRLVHGTGRVTELQGWIRRSPILAVAFGLVVLASIGIPGMAAFEARSSLVSLAVDGPLRMFVLLGTLAPVAYYGRLLSIGLAPRGVGTGPEEGWRPRGTRIDLTGLGSWWATTWNVNRAFSGALVAVALGLLAVATSAGAFGLPEAAAGPPPAADPAVSLGPASGANPAGAVGPGGAGDAYSFGASTQRSTSRS